MIFRDFVDQIVGLINFTVPVLAGIAVALFIVSGVRYIYKSGSAESKGKERNAMMWGLVALFVLFSIWGILNLLDETFFAGASGVGPSNSNNPEYCLESGHCLY